MIFFYRHLATSWAFSEWRRLLSILRRYKQIPANIRDYFWHTDYNFYCLTDVESLGT
jgi:hypothetical protein